MGRVFISKGNNLIHKPKINTFPNNFIQLKVEGVFLGIFCLFHCGFCLHFVLVFLCLVSFFKFNLDYFFPSLIHKLKVHNLVQLCRAFLIVVLTKKKYFVLKFLSLILLCIPPQHCVFLFFFIYCSNLAIELLPFFLMTWMHSQRRWDIHIEATKWLSIVWKMFTERIEAFLNNSKCYILRDFCYLSYDFSP